jgi:hypothetical protein
VVGGLILESFFGYGANGQIDEFVRLVDPHTVLAGFIASRSSNRYWRL